MRVLPPLGLRGWAKHETVDAIEAHLERRIVEAELAGEAVPKKRKARLNALAVSGNEGG